MGWSRSQKPPMSISTVLRKSTDGTLKLPSTLQKQANMNRTQLFYDTAKQAMHREIAALSIQEGYLPYTQKLASHQIAQLEQIEGQNLDWLRQGIKEAALDYSRRGGR